MLEEEGTLRRAFLLQQLRWGQKSMGLQEVARGPGIWVSLRARQM